VTERFCLHDSAVLVEEEDIARLGKQVGNYRLDKILGRGGMGTVYSGEHIYIKKPVAVKVLHPQFAKYQEAIHRFLREARAATSINHPNIVDVTLGYCKTAQSTLSWSSLKESALRI
jgi:serine/threonine protein kinase